MLALGSSAPHYNKGGRPMDGGNGRTPSRDNFQGEVASNASFRIIRDESVSSVDNAGAAAAVPKKNGGKFWKNPALMQRGSNRMQGTALSDGFGEEDLSPLASGGRGGLQSFNAGDTMWMHSGNWTTQAGVAFNLRSLWAGQNLATRYMWAETKRNRRSFFIGLFTVFLVVFFICVLQNAVLKSPIIFFKISENSVGENDLVMTPGLGVNNMVSTSFAGLPLINQTFVQDMIHGDTATTPGSTARWVLIARVTNPVTATDAHALVLGINSVQEQRIGLGRAWPFPPLLASQCYLSRSIVRQIGMDPATAVGKTVMLGLNLMDIASTLSLVNTTDEGAITPASYRQLLTLAFPPLDALWERRVFGAGAYSGSGAGLFNISQYLENQLSFRFNLSNNALSTALNDLFDIYNDLNAGIFRLNSSDTQRRLNEQLNELLRNLTENGGLPGGFSFNRSVLNNDIVLTVNITDLLHALGVLNPNTTLMGRVRQLQDDINQRLSGLSFQFSFNLTDIFLPDAQGGFSGTIDLTQFFDQWNNFVFTFENNATVGDLLWLMEPSILGNAEINANFELGGVVDQPAGKWPEAYGSVIILEIETMIGLVRSRVLSILDFETTPATSGINLGSFDLFGQTFGPFVFEIPGLPTNLNLVTLMEFIGVPNQNNTLQNTVTELKARVASISAAAYALMADVQFAGRFDSYVKTLDELHNDMAQFTNAIAESIGVKYPATFTIPIAIALEQTIYIRYFLENIFGAVIALIVVLSMLLVYALLLNDVEGKTYEYGMLRALGMKHTTLVQVLITKSLMFSLPAIGLGLFFGFLCSIPISDLIAGYANIPAKYALFASAVLVAFVIGFVMPFVANIVPIQRALSRTLRDSLDIYHHVISEVTVRVIKLAQLGLDLWQTAIAVLLLVTGFVTFYIIPYAFTFNNIPLFLGVLNGVLLGMLLGLCIIAQLLQPTVERWILRVMLLGYHRELYGLVRKNLNGHRNRNRKTAQMFTLCLAFIIFAGAMFSLQARSLSDNIKVFVGSDIMISSPPFSGLSESLLEEDMRPYLNQEVARTQAGVPGAVLDSFTFVSYDIVVNRPIDDRHFGNLPEHPSTTLKIVGVERNFFRVIYNEFFLTTETNVPSGMDPVTAMFDDAGNARLSIESSGIRVPPSILSGRINYILGQEDTLNHRAPRNDSYLYRAYHDYIDTIAGEALRDVASIDIDTPLKFNIRHQQANGGAVWVAYLGKLRAIVRKVPGFLFSSYRQTLTLAPVIISMDAYERMMREAIADSNDRTAPAKAPKTRLHLRTTDGASLEDREDLINGLRTFFRNDKTVVIDVRQVVEQMQTAVDLLNLFFTIVGLIAMILCFFILWLSFTANVRENAWEFGVLRAIGLNGVQVVMIYIYEALAIVLSSVFLGTSIGIIISVSLTLQFNLFTEMPFVMQFPVDLFVVLFFMSIFCAVIGSYYPAHSFLKKTISNVIRRQ